MGAHRECQWVNMYLYTSPSTDQIISVNKNITTSCLQPSRIYGENLNQILYLITFSLKLYFFIIHVMKNRTNV